MVGKLSIFTMILTILQYFLLLLSISQSSSPIPLPKDLEEYRSFDLISRIISDVE
jgi:hypothetical protein